MLKIVSAWDLGAIERIRAIPSYGGKASLVETADGRLFYLYPRLPGRSVEEHYQGDSSTRAERLGRAIGILHTHLSACGDLTGFAELSLPEQIGEQALPRIRKHEDLLGAGALQEIWEEVEPDLARHRARYPGSSSIGIRTLAISSSKTKP